MASMNGYATFDFKGPSVGGWAKGAEQVRVLYDGRVVGQTVPEGTTEELQERMPGAATFQIDTEVSFTALDVVSKRLVVVAVAANGETFTLRFTDARRLDLADQAVNEVLSTVPESVQREIRQRSLAWPQVAADRLARRMDRGEVSPQLVPAHLRAPGGEVITGMHGHLFLVGTDNSVLDLYDADSLDVGDRGPDGVMDDWAAVFEARRTLTQRFDATYLHVVIPEKLTALRRWAPVPVSGPTPLMTRFGQRFDRESWHVDVLDLFEGWQHPEEPFLTTDSRLSAAGAQALVARIADAVAPDAVPQIEALPLREVSHLQGDLAKIMQLPFYSRAMRPETALMRRYAVGLRDVERSPESTRGQSGRMLRWLNGTAPADLKVQIFGGAMVGEGDAPERLAWWAKHFFREVRVDWRRDVDASILEEFQPDVVITQTNERDLSTVPTR